MNRSTTRFLQFAIVLIGLVFLALLLWEPQIEGRNAHATQFQVYFNDPFLVYAYAAAIPVFVALHQAFKALGYVGQNRTFSPATARALRTIRTCALTVVGFLLGGEAWLFLYMSGKDDIVGGVAIGLFFLLISLTVAAITAMLERAWQRNALAGP